MALDEVVVAEGPIHRHEAARRVAHAYGIRRVGGRIDEKIEMAMKEIVSHGIVARRGSFLWPKSMETPPLRDRSAMEPVEKRIDYVPPEEIALAVMVAVNSSCGLPEADAPAEAARLLGFGRTGHDIKSAIGIVADELVDDGALECSGGYLIARRAQPT